jgi:ectoine hydrolase
MISDVIPVERGEAVTNSVSKRMSALVADAGLDAVVLSSPENVAYGLGFVVPSQPLMRWRHAAVVFCADGRTAAVCVDMELATVTLRRPDLEVRPWAEFTGSAMASLAELLADLGLAGGRVGVELRYLPHADYVELASRMPAAALVAADDALIRSRAIKAPDEVDLIGRLARMADRAILTAFDEVAAGSTEMDLAAALTRSVYEQGAEQFKLMIVATGERSQLPNVGPSDRKLSAGDVCRVEIFPVIDGYHAGVCRTAVVGDPPPFAQEIYDNLAACKRMILGVMKDGVSARDVYGTFRSRFDQLGLAPISFVGHGIGVDLHEQPYLAAFSDAILRDGMVISIEPLVYRTGHGFGMQIKDVVAVTGDGCQLLSDVSDTDTLLRIGS